MGKTWRDDARKKIRDSIRTEVKDGLAQSFPEMKCRVLSNVAFICEHGDDYAVIDIQSSDITSDDMLAVYINFGTGSFEWHSRQEFGHIKPRNASFCMYQERIEGMDCEIAERERFHIEKSFFQSGGKWNEIIDYFEKAAISEIVPWVTERWLRETG